MNVLVIDIGGTHVKVRMSGEEEPHKIPSGATMTPRRMVAAVKRVTKGAKFDRVSIGYPGPVLHGRPIAEPHNLAPGWVAFDFEKAIGRKVRVINDAAMQALGSYRGGRMLFLGLGTGLGSALIIDGRVEPMELAHLPYRKGKTYEDWVGLRGLKRLGKKKWRRAVIDVVELMRKAFSVDDVVLGGGNAKKLESAPPGTRIGDNGNAFLGGLRLWEEKKVARRRAAG